MGRVDQADHFDVIAYLILKFVVPNIPGSAPLPASLVIILYMMLTHRGL